MHNYGYGHGEMTQADYVLIDTALAFKTSTDPASDVLWSAFDLAGNNPFELTGIEPSYHPLFDVEKEVGFEGTDMGKNSESEGAAQNRISEVIDNNVEQFSVFSADVDMDYDYQNFISEEEIGDWEDYMISTDPEWERLLASRDKIVPSNAINDTDSEWDETYPTQNAEPTNKSICLVKDSLLSANRVNDLPAEHRFHCDYKRLADDLMTGFGHISAIGKAATTS